MLLFEPTNDHLIGEGLRRFGESPQPADPAPVRTARQLRENATGGPYLPELLVNALLSFAERTVDATNKPAFQVNREIAATRRRLAAQKRDPRVLVLRNTSTAHLCR